MTDRDGTAAGTSSGCSSRTRTAPRATRWHFLDLVQVGRRLEPVDGQRAARRRPRPVLRPGGGRGRQRRRQHQQGLLLRGGRCGTAVRRRRRHDDLAAAAVRVVRRQRGHRGEGRTARRPTRARPRSRSTEARRSRTPARSPSAVTASTPCRRSRRRGRTRPRSSSTPAAPSVKVTAPAANEAFLQGQAVYRRLQLRRRRHRPAVVRRHGTGAEHGGARIPHLLRHGDGPARQGAHRDRLLRRRQGDDACARRRLPAQRRRERRLRVCGPADAARNVHGAGDAAGRPRGLRAERDAAADARAGCLHDRRLEQRRRREDRDLHAHATRSASARSSSRAGERPTATSTRCCPTARASPA